MADRRRERRKETERRDSPRGLPPAVFVTLLAALAAGVAGHLLAGIVGWVAMGVAVLAGAYATALAAGGSTGDSDARSRVLVSLLDRGGSQETRVPPGFAGEWATVYQRVNKLSLESQTNSAALPELERFRRQAEMAEAAFRDGKDPLTEIAELRVGPLRNLLEAAKSGATVGPVVSRLSLGEEELIGVDGDTLPEAWPKAAAAVPIAPHDHDELGRGLDELLRGISDLSASLGGDGSRSSSARGSGATRTPAQLVDAVVLTAADGIEDLAAGLMRANELASVAERVTNRATLLALNAALEATRSGSEAFAAIAEETRRLAEFAREATDTISRLASEIEYKVGETITAIHATSEDAKTSLADLSGAPVSTPTVPHEVRAQVKGLLERARELKRRWGASAPASRSASEPDAYAPRASEPDTVAAPDPTAVVAPAAPAFLPEQETPDAGSPDTGSPNAGSPAHFPDSFGSAQSLLQNDRFTAEKLPTEGILLIEGLQPGARLDS